MENDTAPEEKFEISLRILGNEIFAMQLLSQSQKRNWAIFGLIALVLLTALANQLLPMIQQLAALV